MHGWIAKNNVYKTDTLTSLPAAPHPKSFAQLDLQPACLVQGVAQPSASLMRALFYDFESDQEIHLIVQ